MSIAHTETLGLPPLAGNFELQYDHAQERLILACVAPISSGPEVLAGRVYARRAHEGQYTLVGSLDPFESWTSPLLWRDGILDLCSSVSSSRAGVGTVGDFAEVKYVNFGAADPQTLWSPSDPGVWIAELLNRGPRADEICCRVGRLSASGDRAVYSVAMLDLARDSLTDLSELATPFY
jgi:hypothetical protein